LAAASVEGVHDPSLCYELSSRDERTCDGKLTLPPSPRRIFHITHTSCWLPEACPAALDEEDTVHARFSAVNAAHSADLKGLIAIGCGE
jgi:hypothetical protein